MVRVKTGPGFSGQNETGVKTMLSKDRVDLLALVGGLGLGMSDCVLPQLTPDFPMIRAVVHWEKGGCIERHGCIVNFYL